MFAIYERSNYRPALGEAVGYYRAAQMTWEQFARHVKNTYRADVTFGPEYFQRGHWLDRLEAIDADIADMEKLLNQTSGSEKTSSKFDLKTVEQAMDAVRENPKPAEPPPLAEFHQPPPSFRRGQPLTIVTHTPKLAGVRLRYRHVNQAETWQMVAMERTEEDFRAVIPADYTDSPFPLQYHFQIRAETGVVRLYPGLQPGGQGQPYFVVRQA